MSMHKTKLVHCNSITYVYDYVSSKNISTFTFEDESMQLQRLILTNFVGDYVVEKLKLHVTKQQLGSLKSQLENFLLQVNTSYFKFLTGINKSHLDYLAVLQFDDQQKCLHVLTNTFGSFTSQQLTELWGNTVEIDSLHYEELIDEFTELANPNTPVTAPFVYKSSALKKALVLHNEEADDFIAEHELLETEEYYTYELEDDKCGTVTVNEYRNQL